MPLSVQNCSEVGGLELALFMQVGLFIQPLFSLADRVQYENYLPKRKVY